MTAGGWFRGKAGLLPVKNGRIEKIQGQFQGKRKVESLVRSQHSGRISRPPSSSGYLKEEQWSPPRGAAAYQQAAAGRAHTIRLLCQALMHARLQHASHAFCSPGYCRG